LGEIFLSYARPQAEIARAIADALRALGRDVWRDDELPPDRAYADVIQERLNDASAVLVLWSAAAIQSQWVRAEADIARHAGKLVQMSVDGVAPPLPFNQIQCDRIPWPPKAQDKSWRKVTAALAALCGSPGLARAAAAAAAAAAEPQPVTSQSMLAVLAFDNLSDDAEIGYFSDGVAEDILQAVSRAGYIQVAGRMSSFRYRGADKVVATIAAELSASHVLDGSVRRSGNHVRVSASLIECATQAVLWSEHFDREIADVFALQDEISHAVAVALEIPLAAPDRTVRVDPRAYDLYLKARSLGGVPADAAECVALLEQAVAIAPGYAAAWAALAMATILHTRYRERDHYADRRPAMIAAAERAIAIDPATSLAYVALSEVQPLGAFAYREELLAQAIPSGGSEVLKYVADFAQAVGRNAEAFELISRAYEIDPLNRLIANNYAMALADTGFRTIAFQSFAAARAIWPDFDWLVTAPLVTAALTGDWAEADRLLALPVDWNDRRYAPAMTTVMMVREPTPERLAMFIASAWKRIETKGAVSLSWLMMLCAVGEVDAAFALADASSFAAMFDLEGAPPDDRMLLGILFGCGNASMRRDPRFVGLCARLGLVDYWQTSGHWPDCVTEIAHYYDFHAEAGRLATPARSTA
jgi:adenylate cyclase